MLKILTAKNLQPLYGIKHGFFTRKGGVSDGVFAGLNCGQSSDDKPANVEENRRLAALYFEAEPENLLSCQQIHSPDVVVVKESWYANVRPKADAMVTRMQGLALGILTADCVPLLFADVRGGVIGAAHAGWRGAVGGVIEKTLKAMEDLGAQRSRIEVALGPCIWQNSYEVGPEFAKPFLAESWKNEKFFRDASRIDHKMFDLPGYVENKLRDLGVASVESSPADTAADEDLFFSYRRNTLAGLKGVGSLLSAIMFIAPTKKKDDNDPFKTWQTIDNSRSNWIIDGS